MSPSRKTLTTEPPQPGRLDWIGLTPTRGAELVAVTEAEIRRGTGLEGDHHTKDHRQVTLIQAEHLPVVAQLLGRESLAPSLVRRNLVVSGINLAALMDRQFRVGQVLLATTGDCPPCILMEEKLGGGGLAAMQGHGGITARVLEDGVIRLGDAVTLVQSDRAPDSR